MRLRALVMLLFVGLAAKAETKCEDCWTDQCKQFKGTLPKCKVAAQTAKPKTCTAGMELVSGHCCWEGQVHAEGRCRGIPASCPTGFRVDEAQEACVLVDCGGGQMRQTDGVTCCWRGQVAVDGNCRGRPSECPQHFLIEGETCSDREYRARAAEEKKRAEQAASLVNQTSVREDGRVYVRVFTSSNCLVEITPGRVPCRNGDLVPVPLDVKAFTLAGPCGGYAEVYFGKEEKPRVSESFAKGQPLRLQFRNDEKRP